MVGVVMGSKSDWNVMANAVRVLNEFNVPCEYRVLSAHRSPDAMYQYASTAKERGLVAIIAGAGRAAHLPGMLAALTPVPVLGVPLTGNEKLGGMDSLFSIVQMPRGIPVATFALDGAENAALFVVAMLANNDLGLAEQLDAFRSIQRQSSIDERLELKEFI